MSRTTGTRLWTLVFFAVFIWSAIHPHDRLTWLLEVAPALIGMMLMAITYQRFPLTPLLYILILLHCVVLMIGGHYTYAEVPFFEGLLGAERNNYDKLGHFFQGFVPAILAREILIRLSVVPTAAWRNVFIVSLCLAFSAFYELIEWWVALLSDEAAESFLGTQGYVWDTQSDMAFALTGAILALLLLSNFHDSQLKRFV
jgi:putative membrane protein